MIKAILWYRQIKNQYKVAIYKIYFKLALTMLKYGHLNKKRENSAMEMKFLEVFRKKQWGIKPEMIYIENVELAIY
jgi:hypothetical protein